MKLVTDIFDSQPHYLLEHLGEPSSLLFFDIETTGFSGSYASVYLIGAVYYQQRQWHLIQWFADSAEAEVEILTAFFKFIKSFQTLVHFNGDRFDIPFLLKRVEHYQMPFHFNDMISIDIYKKIKPYRNRLGLESLKQKAIEQFLGVSREDLYSGGELIEVYNQYLLHPSETFYHLLMLHNADDLKGMTAILPILCYPDFFEHDFSLHSYQLHDTTDLFGDSQMQLCLTCKSQTKLPVNWHKERLPLSAAASQDSLLLTVHLYQGVLKYFHPNHRDYYYLPYEDIAVHKSVGLYVEKDARQKATAQNCYVKKESVFIPQFEPLWEPAFKQEYKAPFSYAEYSEELLKDSTKASQYIKHLISFL